LFFEPEPAIKFISKNSEKLSLLRCPAVTDFLKNVYIIKSPLDFSLEISENKVIIINNRQNFKEPFEIFDLSFLVDYKSPDTGLLFKHSCIDIGFQYYFINNGNNVSMQNIDVPLYFNRVANVPGEFNISSWVRPTNFTFFTDKKEISFNRGDPLYAVKFITKNNEVVKLEKIVDKQRIDKITFSQLQSTGIKKFLPKLSLSESYNIFKNQFKELFK
jgi:hypothetical protein